MKPAPLQQGQIAICFAVLNVQPLDPLQTVIDFPRIASSLPSAVSFAPAIFFETRVTVSLIGVVPEEDLWEQVSEAACPFVPD
jgi:hypothetical protein